MKNSPIFTLKNYGPGKMAAMRWLKRNGWLKSDAVCWTGVTTSVGNGLYEYVRTISVDPTYSEARKTVGESVLQFRNKTTGAKLHVFGQTPDSFGRPVYASGVALQRYVFKELQESLLKAPVTPVIVVKKGWALFGVASLRASKALLPSLPDGDFDGLDKAPVIPRASRPSPAPATPAKVESSQPNRVAKFSLEKPAQKGAQTGAPNNSSSQRVSPRSGGNSRSSSSGTVHRTTTVYRDRTVSRDDDDFIDFMFMSAYPDIAPLYKPSSMYAWMVWSEAQQRHRLERYDSYRYDSGIPGFPTAVTEVSTPIAGGRRVELLDTYGNEVACFDVLQAGGGSWQIQVDDRCSYQMDLSGSSPALYYDNNGVSLPVTVLGDDGTTGDSTLANSLDAVMTADSLPSTSGPDASRMDDVSVVDVIEAAQAGTITDGVCDAITAY